VPTRHAGCGAGRQRVERDGVLVQGDADLGGEILGMGAGHPDGLEVDQGEVGVGAAGDAAQAVLFEPGRQRPRAS